MCYAALYQLPDGHDAPRRVGQAWYEINLNIPTLPGLAKLQLCIFSLREQGHRAACPQQRIGLFEQDLEGGERPGGHNVGPPREMGGEFLDPLRMHGCRRRRDALGLAQERSLLRVALNQVDHGAGLVRERAGHDETGKAAARSEIDPDARIRRERNELKRVRDVSRPQMRDRGRRDEIGRALPLQQQRNEAIETLHCFT